MGIPVVDNFIEGAVETVDDVFDAVVDAVQEIGPSIEDLGTQLSIAATDAVTDLLSHVDDIIKDVAKFIWKLPETIIDAVMTMFRDPDFWKIVMLWLGLVMGAKGLSAAEAAPAGTKWAAFLEGSKSVYTGMHVDTLINAHRVSYLVSPTYRDSVNDVMGDFAEDANNAGLDIGVAMSLFRGIGNLSKSFGTMIGKDWDWAEADWAESFQQIGDVTSKTLKEWGENPNAMFDWLNENIVRPRANAASGFMNALSDGVATVSETADKIVSDFLRVTADLSGVARDLDELTGTNLTEELEKGLVGFGRVLEEEWKYNKARMDDISQALEFRTQYVNEALQDNERFAFRASELFSNDLAYDNRQLKQEMVKKGIL